MKMENRHTLAALNGAGFLLMLGVGMITPLLPGKIFNYTHSATQVGGLAAAFAFSYVLVQVPMGILADRYGFKHFIVVGYIFCAIAGGFYLFARSSGRLLQRFFLFPARDIKEKFSDGIMALFIWAWQEAVSLVSCYSVQFLKVVFFCSIYSSVASLQHGSILGSMKQNGEIGITNTRFCL